MSRQPKVWWNSQKGTWCTEFGGKRRTLAKGKANEKEARRQLKILLQEQELLMGVGGQISVACLCEHFLRDAKENLQPTTYQSYQYGCQKLVDQLGNSILVGGL